MLAALGLTVARQIPIELLGGLITGAYTAHGGVVRNRLGQIVAHLAEGRGGTLTSLIPGVSLLTQAINTGQIMMVARDVKQLAETVSTVLTVASAGAALSGVGLVVSAAGYATLARRLDRVQEQVDQLKKLIEVGHLSILKAGLDDLKRIESSPTLTEDNRHAIAHSARDKLNQCIHLYGDRWTADSSVKAQAPLEECYALAFTGLSWAEAELGMFTEAGKDFDRNYDKWRNTSTTFVRDVVLGKNPSRLLVHTVADLPTAEFAGLCDFANGTQRGLEWIDQARDSSRSRWFNRAAKKSDSEMIAVARRWMHRDNIMQSQRAHIQFLSERRLPQSTFIRAIEDEGGKNGAEALCVLPKPKSGWERMWA